MTKKQLEALLELLDNRRELEKIDAGDPEVEDWHPTYIENIRQSIPKLTAIITEEEIDRLKALLKEARDELAVYVRAEHPYRDDYPDEMRRYKRDMDLFNRIAAAIRKGTND